MSELINWHEHRNDIVGWFILEAITKGNLIGTPGFDSTALNVTLTINGVEVDCKDMLEYWSESMDKVAAEKAKELIDEEVRKVFDELEELRKRMIDRVPWKEDWGERE